MDFSTANEWLDWIATLHTTEIDLGLERVRMVGEKLGVLAFACPVIIVGGTNGKGSTVAGLEAIYGQAGYQTGTFTSPMLLKPNEQVRVNGKEISDEALCQAFAKVAAARGEVSLTPFEFFTLAALIHFKTQPLEALILEVGLGGRLDAVNSLAADVAVLTTIAMDHMDYLGNTREAIAMEKAGIFRSGRPAVCGDDQPPSVIMTIAENLDVPLYRQGKDFYYQETETGWEWFGDGVRYAALPPCALALQNMSTVLMVVTLLQQRLPVTEEAIKQALGRVTLPGRLQVVNGDIPIIYDVAHNPASIALLAQYLRSHPIAGKTYAVFSMLADKDIADSIEVIRNEINYWYVAPLTGKRAASVKKLLDEFEQTGIHQVSLFTKMELAYTMAMDTASLGDRIVVFGSFRTIAEVWNREAK